jgi:hypothetical protein
MREIGGNALKCGLSLTQLIMARLDTRRAADGTLDNRQPAGSR